MAAINNILARQQGDSGAAGWKGYGLPSQTVSVATKEEDWWRRANMEFMAMEARRQTRDKAADIKKYRYLSDDYQYPKNSWVFDPLFLGEKKEEMYGATDPIQHYPIMNQPLNTIWGERINRNYHFYVLSDSPDSFNEHNRTKTELLFDDVSQRIQQRAMMKAIGAVQAQGIQVNEQVIQQVQQEVQTMSAPAIQRYMDKDYIDVIEQASNRMMKNLWRTCDLDDEFVEGFRHATISGKEAYSIEVANRRLRIKHINPFCLFCHKSPSERWISKGQYAGYRVWYTPSSIIDMYRDKLTVEDIDHIESKLYPSHKSGGVNSLSGIKSISYDTSTYSSWQGETYRYLNNIEIDSMINEFMTTGVSSPRAGSMGLMEVIQAYWKSYRKAGTLHYYDEKDVERTMWVDENYEPDVKSGEWIKWYYLNQVYQGTMIDEDIVLDVCPYEYQYFDTNDPDYSPLPIEGCYTNDFNGKTISMTDLMMPWQEMYDILGYELRRDLKKAMGKVMFMSIDHIPNIPGFDMNKWMYWCREFGIAWVGESKKKSQFSHYSAQDMSFAEQIIAKMNMMERVKHNCDAFAGFSPPRLADTSKEPTAAQAELSNRNSVNQTEYYFWKHSQLMERVLRQALDINKKLIACYGTVYMRNMYDDMEQRYIESDAGKIRNGNLNLFVVHGSQAITRTESVRQMALSAAAKKGEELDMADLLMATTENEVKQMLREMRRLREQQMQQQREHEQQIAQMDAQDKKDERQWQKEKHYSQLESEERQEYMRTFMNQQDNMKDTDQTGVPDILEGQAILAKQSADLQKHQRELRKNDQANSTKNRELSIKEKELTIKKDQNQIARENMKNDLQIAEKNRQGRAKSKSGS